MLLLLISFQLKTEGMGLLYRGLLPPLIMRTTTRSIMFGMFDRYKQMLHAQDQPGYMSSLTRRHAAAAFLGMCRFLLLMMTITYLFTY